MADKNQSAGRPDSQITTGCARMYLVKMRKKTRDSLKAENVSVLGESRQVRSGMAKVLDPRNKANQTQKLQAGSMVVKELRRVSSGFSLKTESRLSAAAVEAKKHYIKAVVKEEVCGY
jgi:hypothetical protein